ncbi:hypothetical protein IAQ61_001777 [Plenodomus lingam]|uniref:uncharacterized protein n=1 Tax=Leptosphaeria maculans TaxID=5022 RepID=UPI00332E3499|nr:hypothetical protein IAQ61_001777 [Plenodomus lingam]
MSSSSGPDQTLGDAVLQSVQYGLFPQDEHLASAPVPCSTLPTLSEVIAKARDETKTQIRVLSREAAPDVDGWITQARKLQDDIKRSQETAKEIVQQAQNGKQHTARVQDSASKVSLLHAEIAYNESLAQVVEQLRDISTLIDSAQNAVLRGHIMHALQTLKDAHNAFKRLGAFEATSVVGVLKSKEDRLRKTIVETVTNAWGTLVAVDDATSSISLKQSVQEGATMDIEVVVDALVLLGLFDGAIARLSRDIDRLIVSPRITADTNSAAPALVIEEAVIRCEGTIKDGSVKTSLEDVHRIAEYLNTRLPSRVAVPLSAKLVPVIASRLICHVLLPAVPLATSKVQDFQETLSYVLGLVEYLDELGWSGQNCLTDWVDKSAEYWLARQKEAAIARVQTLLPKKIQEKKSVERVETQLVSKGDALHVSDDQDDDWGADWDDNDESTAEQKDHKEQEEEEDMSAWGEDDDIEKGSSANEVKAANSLGDEDVDEWGAEWGDEEEKSSDVPLQPTNKPMEPTTGNVKPLPQKAAVDQEVTLRETYTVTAVPDSILDIIQEVITDVKTLNGPELAQSAITPASGGLYAVPSLLLAMYRATAVMHYSKDIASNMLIYNDCQRLSDRLRILLRELQASDQASALPNHLQPSVRLAPRIEADIRNIDGFGKRAYGREMESQRQILRDHLEDAQGFQGCTNMPFAAVCDDAIATTIDRISEVKRQWQNILSHSALLQSLGSLVSATLTKFINDVEEMSDIAEDESRKLHSCCVSLASLSQHFQTQDDSGETREMVSIYTPAWFKFQYLSEILDSSLADIKYFWTDGELKLEMEAEEVVGLIEALFAPSDHRRRAIAEIRRTSMQ